MTIHYRDTEPGVYRSVRIWQDDQGMFVLDCERTDGTLGPIEWEYADMAEALDMLPVLYAVQVLGARIVMVPQEPNKAQASAPAAWHVYLPIKGGGEQGSVYKRKSLAESALRHWMIGAER